MKITRQLNKIMSLMVVAVALGAASPAWAYEELAHNGNGVRVTVIPTVLVPDQQAKFDLSFNTHSVELDQDLTAVAELNDDQGRSLRPRQWDGSPPGGHHRKGTLIFPALPASVKSVTLTIRNVADVPERTFTWQVEP
jgi:hypothetical protein